MTISVAPDLMVMKNAAENVHGGEVVPVEDQGVPSLPYVPKEEKHDVGTSLIWEGEFTAKCPWSAVLSRQWQVSKTKPNISRTWALNKNVSVSFQLCVAQFTI